MTKACAALLDEPRAQFESVANEMRDRHPPPWAEYAARIGRNLSRHTSTDVSGPRSHAVFRAGFISESDAASSATHEGSAHHVIQRTWCEAARAWSASFPRATSRPHRLLDLQCLARGIEERRKTRANASGCFSTSFKVKAALKQGLCARCFSGASVPACETLLSFLKAGLSRAWGVFTE